MCAHLHASTDDLLKLLTQLENEGSCSLRHLLAYWRVDQHDVINLSLVWLAKLGFIRWSNSLNRSMTQSENSYRNDVFLEDLRN